MQDDHDTLMPAVSRTITVNGRDVRWTGDEIDGRELARIAFPHADPDRHGRALTVTYSGGPPSRAAGVLPSGGRIAVTDRQSFNVGLTDKS